MIRPALLFILLLNYCIGWSQKKPEDFDFRHLQFDYKGENVSILVKSKKGEEMQKKPLFFFCQGSLPQPVLKYDERGLYGVFPFDENAFLETYHVVIVGKPGVPVIANAADLDPNNMSWLQEGRFPLKYSENNYLEYYVERNRKVLQHLFKQDWANNNNFTVAGHSEGTYIAIKMAKAEKKTSRLILASANPYGRILSILAEDRYKDRDELTIDYWKSIVAENTETQSNGGDSYKTTYSFSQPVAEDLLDLKIPVLFCYGTKDWSAPYNDMFQTEAIRRKKSNIAFLTYRGLEHNFFPVDKNLQPDYNTYNWTKVGNDWLTWLKS